MDFGDFIALIVILTVCAGFVTVFTLVCRQTGKTLDTVNAKFEAFHQSTVSPDLPQEQREANSGLWKLASVAAAVTYVGGAASIMPAIAIVPAAIAYRGLKRRFADEDDRLTAAD